MNLTNNDIECLEAVNPIGIELTGTQAFFLLAALQLAARHPRFEEIGPVAFATVRDIGNGLTNYMSGVSANVFDIAVAGWQKPIDGAAGEAAPVPGPGRIILPS